MIISKPEAIHRIEELANKSFSFYEADVRDEEKLREIFAKEKIDAVIHFAGLKAVGESVQVPLKYYNNNLISTLVLLDVMNEFGVKNFVFSSSRNWYTEIHPKCRLRKIFLCPLQTHTAPQN